LIAGLSYEQSSTRSVHVFWWQFETKASLPVLYLAGGNVFIVLVIQKRYKVVGFRAVKISDGMRTIRSF